MLFIYRMLPAGLASNCGTLQSSEDHPLLRHDVHPNINIWSNPSQRIDEEEFREMPTALTSTSKNLALGYFNSTFVEQVYVVF